MIAAGIYAVMSVAAVLLVAVWLRFELKKSVLLLAGWPWLVAVVVLQLIAGRLAVVFGEHGLGNVLLHGIGGGAVGTVLFFYLIQTFRLRLTWRLEVVALFCFVCTLGVLNELAEFAMELAGVGIFSFDSRDTWRDFVSNTSGALAVWTLVRLTLFAAKKR